MATRGPLFLLTLIFLVFGLAGKAEARRGPIIINYGDDFYELGKARVLPEESGLELSAPNLKVGYHCDVLGLFWLNIFTWGGEYCLYREVRGETEYEPVTPEVAAALLDKPVGSLEKPWTYSYPPGMFIYGGLLLLGALGKKGNGQKKAARVSGTGRLTQTSGDRPRWIPPPAHAAPPIQPGAAMAPVLPTGYAGGPPPLPPENDGPVLENAVPMAGPPALPTEFPAAPVPRGYVPTVPPPAGVSLAPVLPVAAPPAVAAPSPAPPPAAQPRVAAPPVRQATAQRRYGAPPRPAPPATPVRREGEPEAMMFVPWSKEPAGSS